MHKMIIKQIDQVSLTCVSLVVVIQGILINWFSILVIKYSFEATIMGILSSIGAYVGLYKALILLYKLYGWKFLNKEYYLEGSWTVKVTKSSGSPSVLWGDLTIKQNFDGLDINAQHYSDESKETLWSCWHSTTTWFDDRVLKVFWHADLVNGNSATGWLDIQLDGNKPPSNLIAIFYDQNPSESRGNMQLLRKEKARRRYLQ